MAINPQSPGVYIQEIPVLPASIAGVATAVPVFIGYTEKAESNGIGIPYNTPVRITSLLEYETIFGKGQSQAFTTVRIDDNTTVNPAQRSFTIVKGADSDYKMYYNLQMYFANGGGPCYITSVGLYSNASITMNDMLAGLSASGNVDEPTMILFPDVKSLSAPQVKAVYDAALAQCELLKDRFVIMDVREKNAPGNTVMDDADDFRNLFVGADNLKYGASYYPNLNTVLGFTINAGLVHITAQKVNGTDVTGTPEIIAFLNSVELANKKSKDALAVARIAVASKLALTVVGAATDADTAVDQAVTDGGNLPAGTITTAYAASISDASNAASSSTLAVTAANNFAADPSNVTLATALINALETLVADTSATLSSSYSDTGSSAIKGLGIVAGSLSLLSGVNPSVYNAIESQVTSYTVTLNPSGAMAGIYARVDAQRGVWKAPANVGIASIIGPSINITTSEQDGLNIDATSGKSINAIRTFVGRGTLVWGARTLAGNDNEWRYINVRRLFNYMEESIQEATEFVVFEANTANTWNRVKGMIEAFLTGLWRDGALAGATTKDAFFVRVGLGTTMTAQDILEGRMIVEVGVAAVRPAEFIILKFMHKLQES